MTTVLVCGSRDYSAEGTIGAAIQRASNRFGGRLRIVHGGCSGADAIAGKVAKALGLEVVVVPAEWAKYGRAAGPKRNERMLREIRRMQADGIRTGIIAKRFGLHDTTVRRIRRGKELAYVR